MILNHTRYIITNRNRPRLSRCIFFLYNLNIQPCCFRPFFFLFNKTQAAKPVTELPAQPNLLNVYSFFHKFLDCDKAIVFLDICGFLSCCCCTVFPNPHPHQYTRSVVPRVFHSPFSTNFIRYIYIMILCDCVWLYCNILDWNNIERFWCSTWAVYWGWYLRVETNTSARALYPID